eukprot:scaffold41144_cov50-Attheya_sp.AAC.1
MDNFVFARLLAASTLRLDLVRIKGPPGSIRVLPALRLELAMVCSPPRLLVLFLGSGIRVLPALRLELAL